MELMGVIGSRSCSAPTELFESLLLVIFSQTKHNNISKTISLCLTSIFTGKKNSYVTQQQRQVYNLLLLMNFYNQSSTTLNQMMKELKPLILVSLPLLPLLPAPPSPPSLFSLPFIPSTAIRVNECVQAQTLSYRCSDALSTIYEFVSPSFLFPFPSPSSLPHSHPPFSPSPKIFFIEVTPFISHNIYLRCNNFMKGK